LRKRTYKDNIIYMKTSENEKLSKQSLQEEKYMSNFMLPAPGDGS